MLNFWSHDTEDVARLCGHAEIMLKVEREKLVLLRPRLVVQRFSLPHGLFQVGLKAVRDID